MNKERLIPFAINKVTSRGPIFLPHAGPEPLVVECSHSGLYTSVFSLILLWGKVFAENSRLTSLQRDAA